jgi:hypothetical protein
MSLPSIHQRTSVAQWKPDDGDPSVQDTSDRDDEPVDSRARKGVISVQVIRCFQVLTSPIYLQGWTCDKREVQRSGAVNQDIIDKVNNAAA